ncbi:MAG: hypothetical protein IJI57_03315 [Flexilinea sp.]|nr:hypothetical protein [Flexilinea sp.]
MNSVHRKVREEDFLFRKIQSIMRTKKSLLNMTTALAGQSLSLLANLISRYIFAKYMSQEYLGLSGLFTNILTMLSLVELGVGPAITFSLYKPLAQNDTEKVKSLMHLYKKAYQIIGGVVLILGLLFTPFYPFFIKDTRGIDNLTIIYWLYVLNTGVSYFFSYKISLITADQNQYVRNIGHYAVFIVMNIGQGLILILTRNYVFFLIFQVICTFIENFILSRVADRMYPYLKEKNVQPLTKETTSPIWRNIRAMIFHKVGSIAVNSTDNLLISKYLGLGVSGIYSNYALIIVAVRNILGKVFDSVIASVGNINALEDTEKVRTVFLRMFFLSFWLFSFCGICIACLIQPFIRLVFGENYLLNQWTVIILVFAFYTYGMRNAPNVVRSAAGLYYKDWFKPLLEAAVNLASSILLLQRFGVAGIFMGTIISTILVNAWIEAWVVYKNVLHEPLSRFFIQYMKYFGLFSFGLFVTYKICELIAFGGVWELLFRFLICLLIPNALFCLTSRGKDEYVFFKQLIRTITSNIKDFGRRRKISNM